MAAVEDVHSNVSQDLLWELTRKNSAQLFKQRMSGGLYFSRDPLNLVNKHSRKYDGNVNSKAIGVQPGPEGKGVVLITRDPESLNKPASSLKTKKFSGTTSGRKIYRQVVERTTKQEYRQDLRKEAVARASMVKKSQGVKKADPERKTRGAKARKQEKKGE